MGKFPQFYLSIQLGQHYAKAGGIISHAGVCGASVYLRDGHALAVRIVVPTRATAA